MKKRRILVALGGVALVAVATLVTHPVRGIPAQVIDPPDESEIECTAIENGVTYKLYRSGLYRVNQRSGKWEFVDQWYDPDFYKKNYVERDGAIFRKSSTGALIPVKRQFSEDFENAKSLRDLVGLKRGWTEFTLQSPTTPTVKDYVALRQRILQGQSDFLDNRIELADLVHCGRGALKTYSLPPALAMICAKSSLGTELLHFVKGDDIWLSAWFYVAKGSGMPSTIMDLKTSWIKQFPGMRVMILEDKYASYELKWGHRVLYRQPRGKEVLFPVGQWVHLQAHLKLSEKDDGVIQLWQDGSKIVDARGQTLTTAQSVYNFFEVGITAHNDRSKPATLYVDDVAVSDRPIEP